MSYYKLIDDEGDVVQVVESEYCIEGFVPATKDEYENFDNSQYFIAFPDIDIERTDL